MYPYQLDKETVIATGIVLLAFAAIYAYRKLRSAAHEAVQIMKEAHEDRKEKDNS